MLLADYSDGTGDLDHRIDASQFLARGVTGAIRYLRKRGPSGVAVLLTSEVRDFTGAGFPWADVYEDGAPGWMLGGHAVGVDRALWALRQARATGHEPRCIYFADDGPRDTADQVNAVLACLAGARSALANGGTLDGRFEPPARYGADVAGIYAFRAVMRAVANGNLARYRWLTGSRPSLDEIRQLGLSAYQRNYGGPYTVAGVSVDISDTYVDDWGQLPPPGGMDDVAFTEDDSVLFWGHDVELGDGVTPAWRALADARAQAVAARDAANAAKTGVTQLGGKLDDLAAKVDALGGSTPPPGSALSDDDVQRIARAVLDEQHRRDES